jgi:type II secretory pathway component PulF
VALPNRLTLQEKAQFFYQLAAALNSGMPVQQSLTLASQHCRPSFQRYLQQVSMALDAGQELASALAIDSRYFDRWTISLIRLAEYSGSLPQTCQQLAIAAEAQVRRRRLSRSVRFSVIVTIWSLLILSAAILNPNSTGLVKPEFWLRSFAIALLLLGISVFMSRYSSQRSRQLAMKLPIVGKLIQARSLLDLAQLRLPLSCGVTTLTAVELLKEHIPDPVMRANLNRAARLIRMGQPLSRSLEGKIPSTAMEMIRTGEETGHLDTALENVAQSYETELEQGLHLLQVSLRPLSFIAIASLLTVVGIRGFTVLLDSLSLEITN